MSGCIPITLLKGVVYKENSTGRRPCGTPNSSSHNFNCLETVADIEFETVQSNATHTKS